MDRVVGIIIGTLSYFSNFNYLRQLANFGKIISLTLFKRGINKNFVTKYDLVV